jgi:hypothetical protein
MLTLNQNFKTTLLATLILLSGSVINCIDRVIPQTAVILADLSKSKSVIEQLQDTVGQLRHYCANTAIILELSEAEKSANIEQLVTKIDRLISNPECNLQHQAQQFYWGFSFPAQELLDLGKLDLLEKYLIKANPLIREILETLGSSFTFIGITKADFLKLIKTIEEQIEAHEKTIKRIITTKNPHESGCTTASVAHINIERKEIEKLCRLWKHLNEFNHLPTTTTYTHEDFSALDQTFLEQAIMSNLLSTVKYALSHDNITDRTYALQFAVACYCSPKIIEFIINHSSADPKIRAKLSAQVALWNKEHATGDKDSSGDLDSDKDSCCDSTTCSFSLRSPSVKLRSDSHSSDGVSPVEFTSNSNLELDRISSITPTASMPFKPADSTDSAVSTPVTKIILPPTPTALSPVTTTSKFTAIATDRAKKSSADHDTAATSATFGIDKGQTYFYC